MKLSELFESPERSFRNVCGRVDDPYIVDLGCAQRRITSLEGCPSLILGDFTCYDNHLVSLKGGPSRVEGYYTCSKNYLKDLDGVASYMADAFNCEDNGLTSLHNIHNQIKFIGGSANFIRNPIKSHVLGLLLINGLDEVAFESFAPWANKPRQQMNEIINKHLKNGRDVFACQEELIEAGFDEYAQL